ncbi:polymer-forming cytoskeletal protein [Paenibacillus sp. SC116]|uniref:bactofilin family protein n=1 Tax=Paenibacillus sp. SC116 TaxID=2968986 RepID=UPI00215A955B|nr:polymer-forming cytoskeletal protein [Paenibacillus sp. SC116]MCR8844156.1 polymer-forming cytoskeletal protein [Paenibacillus sp. SC116]
MFGKSSRPSMTDTIISYGTEMEGHLNCQSNLRIDGQFKGTIICQGTVVIGNKGKAHANIEAKQIIIAGTICGELKAEGKLTITSTGHVAGNCVSQSLVIEEGGTLNGISKMGGPESAAEQIQSSTPLPIDNNDNPSSSNNAQEAETDIIFSQDHSNRYHHDKKKKRKEKQAG